jgi:hypothetical protein
MGFFSFKTQDTDESVISKWVEHTPVTPYTREAYIMDNKGNVYGGTYDGYGRFMSKEVMQKYNAMHDELMNTKDKDKDMVYKVHNYLLDNSISFYDLQSSMNKNRKPNEEFIFPNIVSNPKEWTYINEQPIPCEYQGYFIP